MSTSPIPLDHFASDVRARAVVALDVERRRLDRVVAELGAYGLDMRTQEEDLGEIASASQHQADVASETFEREVELGLIDEFRATLGEVAAAELRVADGTHGTCERCGGAVGAERLVAVPATRWCLPCAEAVDARNARWRMPGPRRRAGAARRRRVPCPRRPDPSRTWRRRVGRGGGGAHGARPARGRLTSASVCRAPGAAHHLVSAYEPDCSQVGDALLAGRRTAGPAELPPRTGLAPGLEVALGEPESTTISPRRSRPVISPMVMPIHRFLVRRPRLDGGSGQAEAVEAVGDVVGDAADDDAPPRAGPLVDHVGLEHDRGLHERVGVLARSERNTMTCSNAV